MTHPTLQANTVFTIEISAPESSSIVVFSLLIFPTTLACLNHFPGVWYFQYPLDSPGAKTSSILVGDLAYSSCLLTLEKERKQFEESHVLGGSPCRSPLSLINCFSTNAYTQSLERSARTRFQPGERPNLAFSRMVQATSPHVW